MTRRNLENNAVDPAPFWIRIAVSRVANDQLQTVTTCTLDQSISQSIRWMRLAQAFRNRLEYRHCVGLNLLPVRPISLAKVLRSKTTLTKVPWMWLQWSDRHRDDAVFPQPLHTRIPQWCCQTLPVLLLYPVQLHSFSGFTSPHHRTGSVLAYWAATLGPCLCELVFLQDVKPTHTCTVHLCAHSLLRYACSGALRHLLHLCHARQGICKFVRRYAVWRSYDQYV